MSELSETFHQTCCVRVWRNLNNVKTNERKRKKMNLAYPALVLCC